MSPPGVVRADYLLNPLKTELMWFGSATALRNQPSSVRAVNVGLDVAQPVSVVRNLGVHAELSMRLA